MGTSVKVSQNSQHILIIGEDNDIYEIFMSMGYMPICYSHWAVNTGHTNTVGRQIKDYASSFVWVSFPKLSKKDRAHAHMTTAGGQPSARRQLYLLFDSALSEESGRTLSC